MAEERRHVLDGVALVDEANEAPLEIPMHLLCESQIPDHRLPERHDARHVAHLALRQLEGTDRGQGAAEAVTGDPEMFRARLTDVAFDLLPHRGVGPGKAGVEESAVRIVREDD